MSVSLSVGIQVTEAREKCDSKLNTLFLQKQQKEEKRPIIIENRYKKNVKQNKPALIFVIRKVVFAFLYIFCTSNII
jgi:hypothetical protein